jgi:hypothetical protein
MVPAGVGSSRVQGLLVLRHIQKQYEERQTIQRADKREDHFWLGDGGRLQGWRGVKLR